MQDLTEGEIALIAGADRGKVEKLRQDQKFMRSDMERTLQGAVEEYKRQIDQGYPPNFYIQIVLIERLLHWGTLFWGMAERHPVQTPALRREYDDEMTAIFSFIDQRVADSERRLQATLAAEMKDASNQLLGTLTDPGPGTMLKRFNEAAQRIRARKFY